MAGGNVILRYGEHGPNPRQREAHAAPERYIMFGGAVGGGKSVWLCQDANLHCIAYPGTRAGIFRWEYANFSKTTFKTMEEWVLGQPGLVASHNANRHEITLFNGSQIVYGGLKPSASASGDILSVCKSLELNAGYIDEASDVPQQVYEFFCTRVPRVRCVVDRATGRHGFPPGRIAITSNPTLGWIKSRFVDRQLPGHRFVRSTIHDNDANLSPEYKAALTRDMSEDDVKRYVEGDWGAVVDYAAVCPVNLIAAAVQRRVVPAAPVVFGVDVAAGGQDLTVIVMRQGFRLWVLLAKPGTEFRSTMDTVGAVALLYQRYKPSRIVVDAIGVGKGVFDRLDEMGYPAEEFVAGAKASSDRYLNRRAEAYWEVRQLLEQGLLQLPNHPEATNELGCIRYVRSASDRTITVESKEAIKRRLGKSPNYADAISYACEGALGQYSIGQIISL